MERLTEALQSSASAGAKTSAGIMAGCAWDVRVWNLFTITFASARVYRSPRRVNLVDALSLAVVRVPMRGQCRYLLGISYICEARAQNVTDFRRNGDDAFHGSKLRHG